MIKKCKQQWLQQCMGSRGKERIGIVVTVSVWDPIDIPYAPGHGKASAYPMPGSYTCYV